MPFQIFKQPLDVKHKRENPPTTTTTMELSKEVHKKALNGPKEQQCTPKKRKKKAEACACGFSLRSSLFSIQPHPLFEDAVNAQQPFSSCWICQGEIVRKPIRLSAKLILKQHYIIRIKTIWTPFSQQVAEFVQCMSRWVVFPSVARPFFHTLLHKAGALHSDLYCISTTQDVYFVPCVTIPLVWAIVPAKQQKSVESVDPFPIPRTAIRLPANTFRFVVSATHRFVLDPFLSNNSFLTIQLVRLNSPASSSSKYFLLQQEKALLIPSNSSSSLSFLMCGDASAPISFLSVDQSCFSS